MERIRRTEGNAWAQQGSRTNYFGRRNRLSSAASSEGPENGTPAGRNQTESPTGRPSFFSDAHRRQLNLLGRTSAARTRRLLVNRR